MIVDDQEVGGFAHAAIRAGAWTPVCAVEGMGAARICNGPSQSGPLAATCDTTGCVAAQFGQDFPL